MGVRNLQGTPWHVEQAHRKDGDDRRHRSRCMFYDPITKQCKERWKCIGSRYCMEYEPLSEKEFKQRQKAVADTKRLLAQGYSENDISRILKQREEKKNALEQNKTIKDKPINNKKNLSSVETKLGSLPNLQGKFIKHKGYGRGFVIDQTGDSVEVIYSGSTKTQKLSLLIKNNMIEY